MPKNLQKNRSLKIGKFNFKKGKTFIVAELSGNHNGSFNRAKKLLIKAKESGADAVKLQTFSADLITLNSKKNDFKLDYLNNKEWKRYKTFYSLYSKSSTPWDWHPKLFDLAKKIGIEIFSSPFDETAVDFLEKLKCVAYKIASPEITHIPLITKVAKTKKPVIISTGLASLEDLDLAINTLRKNGCKKLFILKCNSSYPAPIIESNLKNIQFLKNKYNLPIGLSDHTIGDNSAVVAVSLGAKIVEKHFNLKDNLTTVDSFFSSNQNDFQLMVDKIRITEKTLGNYEYTISKSSKKNFASRRSIFISKNIRKNERITKDNIKVVRPSFGLHPKFFLKVLGKKVNKSLKHGERLKIKYLK